MIQANLIQSTQGRLQVGQRQIATPTPNDDQILVKVRATALNRGELLGLPDTPPGTDGGKRFGGEAAGEVIAVGQAVQGIAPGDRIMGRCSGAFADQVIMEAFEALPIPAHLDWAQAASIPLVFTVTYDMLRWQGGVGPGDTVLIAGVSSGVGVAALLLAKAQGAHVIGTSTQQEKLDTLTPHGLDTALVVNGPGFAQQVLNATQGKGVKLAINVVGASLFTDCMASLALGGSVAIVGHVDHADSNPAIDLSQLHARRLSVFGVSNRHRTAPERAALVQGFRRDVLPFFQQATITPILHQVFDATDLQAAIDLMEGNRHVGKIVVTRGG